MDTSLLGGRLLSRLLRPTCLDSDPELFLLQQLAFTLKRLVNPEGGLLHVDGSLRTFSSEVSKQ